MLKRKAKKDLERVIGAILVVLIIVAIALSGNSIINIIPHLGLRTNQRSAIIKPVTNLARLDDLSKALSDRNFIMESLVEGSASGIIIGQIKDGPKVYFSKNKEAEWQAISLDLILSKLIIDNKKPILIDLRFDQPIVKF